MIPEDFVEVSRKIGKDKSLIQGAGGNTSIKIDDENMLIKASGTLLSELSEEKGWVKVNFNQIIRTLDKEDLTDQEYDGSLKNSSYGNEFKPSMETGFHAVLGKAVIHTHSVIVNVITCSQDGKEMLSEIFNNDKYHWIDYKTPGMELSKEIHRKNKESLRNWLFLENHGLIVSGDSMEQCEKDTQEIVCKIKEYLQNKNVDVIEFEVPEYDEYAESTILKGFFKKNAEDELKGHLFPDSIIFCDIGTSIDKEDQERISVFRDGKIIIPKESKFTNENVLENFLAGIYIKNMISQFSKTKLITEHDADKLRNMESEKYRRKLQGKK